MKTVYANMYPSPVRMVITHSDKKKIMELLGFTDPVLLRRVRNLELIAK